MNQLKLTNHCQKRCQQRGTPREVIEFIFKYGNSFRTHQDVKKIITTQTINKIKYKEKEFLQMHDKHIKNTAIVCSGDVVITVMKQSKKLLR